MDFLVEETDRKGQELYPSSLFCPAFLFAHHAVHLNAVQNQYQIHRLAVRVFDPMILGLEFAEAEENPAAALDSSHVGLEERETFARRFPRT